MQVIGPRLPLFEKFLKDKKVLHVGCADWPIFKPDKNLHIELALKGGRFMDWILMQKVLRI